MKRIATTILLPESLDLKSSIDFCAKIDSIASSDYDYIIDYGKMQNVEPSGMLIVGAKIRKLLTDREDANFRPINFKNNDYAAHMGFYQSVQLDYGKFPGEAAGSSTYLPLTQLDVSDIRKESKTNTEHIVDTVERKANQIANVMANQKKDFEEVLTYSIREIMRNVVEHSEANSLWFAAQCWPTKDRVEISILDEGIGIFNSLKRNRKLKMSSADESLYLAIEPGISGKDIKAEQRRDEVYGNSGYGLFMTSRICEDGGDYFIGSSNKLLGVHKKGSRVFNLAFHGTIIRMRLHVSKIKSLQQLTGQYLKEGIERTKIHKKSDVLSASQSSRLLLKQYD